jgi:hypothetical protein
MGDYGMGTNQASQSTIWSRMCNYYCQPSQLMQI